jgi:ABC-type uncharacterized transport system substrate-binding protein
MVHAAGEGVDWMLWRVATEPRISDGMAAIRDTWTLDELTTAHLALDAIEDCRAIAERAGRK